jgi:hypothetical protein
MNVTSQLFLSFLDVIGHMVNLRLIHYILTSLVTSALQVLRIALLPCQVARLNHIWLSLTRKNLCINPVTRVCHRGAESTVGNNFLCPSRLTRCDRPTEAQCYCPHSAGCPCTPDITVLKLNVRADPPEIGNHLNGKCRRCGYGSLFWSHERSYFVHSYFSRYQRDQWQHAFHLHTFSILHNSLFSVRGLAMWPVQIRSFGVHWHYKNILRAS